jgi:large subunit ribosomal protein L25
MAQSELNVEIRENTGKGVARKLRAAGMVPAVVYGKGMEPTPITVEPKALEQAIATEAGWNTLLTLKGAAPVEGKVVVLKELDLHPLKRNMVCADFHAINLREKSSFMIPVVTVGKSAGEKAGGALQVIRHELEVLCLPTEVPQSIEIDVQSAYQQTSCQDCEARFYSIYRLVGFGLYGDDKTEIHTVAEDFGEINE